MNQPQLILLGLGIAFGLCLVGLGMICLNKIRSGVMALWLGWTVLVTAMLADAFTPRSIAALIVWLTLTVGLEELARDRRAGSAS